MGHRKGLGMLCVRVGLEGLLPPTDLTEVTARRTLVKQRITELSA